MADAGTPVAAEPGGGAAGARVGRRRGGDALKVALKKLRGPYKWHGGKAYLARRIIGRFPEHRVYCEPYFGGGSVLLNKPPAEVEVAGDLNGELVNAWTVIRDDVARLAAELSEIRYSEEAFNFWRGQPDDPTDPSLFRAVGFIARNRMSRGGLGKSFAWSERLRGGQPGDLNAWLTIIDELPAISARMRSVRLVQGEAIDLIREHDSPGTLHYCDPPYCHSTRTVRKAYAFEMTEAQHVALLDTLLACKGAVVLSGYASPLYDEALADWERESIEIANHSGQGKAKQRRIECLWSKRAQR